MPKNPKAPSAARKTAARSAARNSDSGPSRVRNAAPEDLPARHMAEVEAVISLAAQNPSVAIHRYDNAGHSFCNPYRPMYDPAAAALVRERTMNFLDEMAQLEKT